MLKDREQFATIILVGFVCFFLFVAYVLKDVHWSCLGNGDKATWVGSGVAFLALIAAMVAAILSKMSSDKQNENSIIISFMSLTQERAVSINEKYDAMKKEVDRFFKQNTDEYMSEEYYQDTSFFFTCEILVEKSSECLSIISRSIFIINQSRIPQSLKKALIREFFFSMSSDFISECLFHYRSGLFFTFNDQKNSIRSWVSSYLENIQSIQKIIVENELFSDRVQRAKENGSLYSD